MNRLLIIVNDEIKKSQLNETLSDIVYHFTHSEHMVNILKTNTISLTSAIGSKADLDVNNKKYFFLSTTRSKNTGYVKGDVKIVLNGGKLNHNYKSVPVDYWQYSKNPNDWGSKADYTNSLKSNEQEDRIVSNKSEIPNAVNYIMVIHVEYNGDSQYSVNNYIDLIAYSKKYNIPIYFYDTRENWLNENKRGLINIDNISKEKNDVNHYSSRNDFDYTIASLIAFNNQDNYQKIVDYLNDDKKVEHFNTELKKRTLNNFKIGALYDYETNSVISAAIHNNRSKANKDIKFLLNLMATEMRKLNANNVNDYLEKKRWSNKKTLDVYKDELYQYFENLMNNEYTNDLVYRFDKYIEIDGEYYNHTYESPEYIKIVNEYVMGIKEYIRNQIYQTEYDIFKYNYKISSSEIIDTLKIKDAKATDKLNITDSGYSDYVDHDIDLVSFLENIARSVGSESYSKTTELYDEYQKQKYN